MSLSAKTSQAAGSYWLYAGTIFLSAFLLFVVQPMAGKHLLPYFGGSSQVWATSVLFFTAVLFLGYLYVYVLTSFAGKRQGLIHAFVAGLVLLVTIGALFVSSTLYGSLEWVVGSTPYPALNVLLALTLAIGAPYFLLSTTGPLLQYWYGIIARKDVYRLYALSNAGSLIALVAYPFLIESNLSLPRGEGIWVLSFLIFACVSIFICIQYLLHPLGEVSEESLTTSEKISPASYGYWVALAALPAFMLVATTTVLTQVVAPVPLLWVVPLALYLITFILAFRGWGRSIFLPPLIIIAAFFAYTYMFELYGDILWRISSYLSLFFLSGLLCHASLYQNRPSIAKLPLFYVLLSFGGMLGALAASMIAPAVFTSFFEFPLGIALSVALAGWLLSEAFFPRILDRDKILLTRIVFLFCVAVLLAKVVSPFDDGTPSLTSRNFYGPAEVRFHNGMTSLLHGTTLHGMQPTSREWRYIPTSYYAPGSGIGRAMFFEKDVRGKMSMRVGVLGLGTGAIAAHCREGDAFVFYEIDPRMEKIARSYFSYLSYCKDSKVRLGDGRLLLESEADAGEFGEYDLVVMDAFSDDTVPAHLLTLEAVKLYAAHLRSTESIIAIHISNRYLNLAPVILRIAAEIGLNAMVVRDTGDSNEFGRPSHWVLLSKGSKVFGSVAFAGTDSKLPDARLAPLWSDDYTSLFTVVNLPLPWK